MTQIIPDKEVTHMASLADELTEEIYNSFWSIFYANKPMQKINYREISIFSIFMISTYHILVDDIPKRTKKEQIDYFIEVMIEDLANPSFLKKISLGFKFYKPKLTKIEVESLIKNRFQEYDSFKPLSFYADYQEDRLSASDSRVFELFIKHALPDYKEPKGWIEVIAEIVFDFSDIFDIDD